MSTVDRVYVKRLPLTLLFAALVVACDTQTPSEFLADAEAAMAAGDSSTAMIHLKNAVRKDPANVSAWLLLADLNLAIGNAESAESQYRRAANLGASGVEYRASLLEALVQLEQFQAALDEVDPADVLATVERAAILRVRGRAYAGLGLLSEAVTEVRESIQLNPDSPASHVELASVFMQMSRYDDADKEIAGALALDAQYPHALYLRGQMERIRGQLEAAEASLKHAARVAGDRNIRAIRFAALDALADIQLAHDRIDDAAAQVRELARISPSHAVVNYHEARISTQQGNLEDAKNFLQQSLRIQKNFQPAQRLLGTIYALEGNYNVADMYLTAAVSADPTDVLSRRMLATVRIGQDRPGEALALLEADMGGDTPEAQRGFLALAARASLESGETEKAVAYFGAASDADPEDWRLQLGEALTLMADGQYDAAIERINSLEDGSVPYRKPALLVFAYLQNGRSDTATTLAQELVDQQPDQAFAHNLLGMVYVATGENEKAYTYLTRALELDGKDVGSLANLARAEAQRGNTVAAAEALRGVVELEPDNAWARVALAGSAFSNDRRDEALQLVQPVLESSVDAQLITAAIQLEQGDLDDAKKIVRDVLKINSASARGHNLLGAIASAQGEYDAAVRSFGEAARLEPRVAGYHRSLARAQLAVGDQEAARTSVANARALDPNSRELAILEVVLFTRDGDFVRAETVMDTLAKSDLDLVTRLSMLGELRMAEGRFGEAEQAYSDAYTEMPSRTLALRAWRAAVAAGSSDPAAIPRDWIERTPNDVVVITTLGSWYMDRNDLETSRQYLEQAVATDPTHVLALNNLAWIYDQLGDERALATAKQAYRLRPDAAAIADTLGWIQLKSGNVGEAFGLLRQAARAAPADAGIQYHLAVAYVESGDIEAARQILTDLIETDRPFPGREDAEQVLSRL